MISIRPFSCLISFFVLAISTHSQVFAERGRINFEGAITEPVCSTPTPVLIFNSDVLKSPTQHKTASNTSHTALQMHCNANQSVQVTFDNTDGSLRRNFDSGLNGVEVSLSYAGKEIRPGQEIPMHLLARQEKMMPIQATVHQQKNATTTGNDKIRGAILISLNYR